MPIDGSIGSCTNLGNSCPDIYQVGDIIRVGTRFQLEPIKNGSLIHVGETILELEVKSVKTVKLAYEEDE